MRGLFLNYFLKDWETLYDCVRASGGNSLRYILNHRRDRVCRSRFFRGNRIVKAISASDRSGRGGSRRLALWQRCCLDAPSANVGPLAGIAAEVPREGGRTAPHERRDSLGNAFADIIRSLTKQWFGAPAPDLNFTKRFLCAGAGSVTFFLVGFYNSLLPETLQLIIDPLYILSNIVAYFLFTMISMWFAWLVSWQDMQYGPIRLYLSGFLLPYFVWFLAVKLPVFEQ